MSTPRVILNPRGTGGVGGTRSASDRDRDAQGIVSTELRDDLTDDFPQLSLTIADHRAMESALRSQVAQRSTTETSLVIPHARLALGHLQGSVSVQKVGGTIPAPIMRLVFRDGENGDPVTYEMVFADINVFITNLLADAETEQAGN